MTEHGLRTEDDRFWPTSEEQKRINQRRLDLGRIKRWEENAFYGVAVPVGAAVIILAELLVIR